MTNTDPLLTDLLHQVTLEQVAIARLELERLRQQRAELEAAPVASTKEPPRRRWYLRKRWLLSAIFLALLLFGGYDQRARLGSLLDHVLAQDPHVQVGSQRVDVPTLATTVVKLTRPDLATVVPTMPTLPAVTPKPTLGTGATAPEAPTGTSVAAQAPRDNGSHDVQPGNTPVQQDPPPPTIAPPPPVEQAAPVAPAPIAPAQPTAAPTAEPEGQVVAASQDAPVQANGEPAVNYELEAQKVQAAATAKAFANGWQGVKP